MIKIEGCKGWQRRQREEVREANARARKTLNKAEYDVSLFDKLTNECMLLQAEAANRLRHDVEDAKKKALEVADSENTSLRAEVDRLKNDLVAQRRQLKEQAEKDQVKLIEENERETEAP